MKSTIIVSSLFLLATAGFANANTLCSYAHFSPGATRFSMAQALNVSGLATVRTSLVFEGRSDNNQLVVAHAGREYGAIQFDENVVSGSSTLTFLDAAHQELARAEESVTPCDSGLCRDTKFTFFMGNRTGTMRISDVPAEGVRYFIENNEADSSTSWFSQLASYKDWVKTSLSNDLTSVLIPLGTSRQNLIVLLASDPVIAPYLHAVSLSANASGELVLSGRVKYTIYNLIFAKARDAGIFNLRPNVIIDSSVEGEMVSIPESLRTCL
jgi:hypothetical protein